MLTKIELKGDLDSLIMVQTDRLILKDLLNKMKDDKRISNDVKEEYFRNFRLRFEKCIDAVGSDDIKKICFLSKLEKELDNM